MNEIKSYIKESIEILNQINLFSIFKAIKIIKNCRSKKGRIFFAGSGPLALAFPAQLSGYGANIVGIIEAAPRPGIFKALRILLAVIGNLDLMRDAAKYQFHLISNRIPMTYRRIIVSANGKDRVESVTHAKVDKNWRVIPGTEKTVEVDARGLEKKKESLAPFLTQKHCSLLTN